MLLLADGHVDVVGLLEVGIDGLDLLLLILDKLGSLSDVLLEVGNVLLSVGQDVSQLLFGWSFWLSFYHVLELGDMLLMVGKCLLALVDILLDLFDALLKGLLLLHLLSHNLWIDRLGLWLHRIFNDSLGWLNWLDLIDMIWVSWHFRWSNLSLSSRLLLRNIKSIS